MTNRATLEAKKAEIRNAIPAFVESQVKGRSVTAEQRQQATDMIARCAEKHMAEEPYTKIMREEPAQFLHLAFAFQRKSI